MDTATTAEDASLLVTVPEGGMVMTLNQRQIEDLMQSVADKPDDERQRMRDFISRVRQGKVRLYPARPQQAGPMSMLSTDNACRRSDCGDSKCVECSVDDCWCSNCCG